MNQELINRVFDWGAKKNLHQNDLRPQLIKLTEELGELAAAVARDSQDKIIDAVGDMLVVLIQFGGSFAVREIDTYGTELDQLENYERIGKNFLPMCLNSAFRIIENRTGKTVNGTFIKDEDAS